MKRRNFIQCIAALPIIGAIPTVAANITENKYAKYARFPVDVSTTIYIGDPYIKIYTENNKVTRFNKNITFTQRGKWVHYSDSRPERYGIPLVKVRKFDKEYLQEFIENSPKYKNIDYYLFEIIDINSDCRGLFCIDKENYV